jgi:hypothetical protein
MDIDSIRSRFIQENLRRALQEQDKERAIRALRAFRNYFQWFETRLPAMERVTILNQLARLEDVQAGNSAEKGRSPATAR